MCSVLQGWVQTLPMMQQTVLLTAIRGPDGLPKYGSIKMLLRWYRRCVLYSAMDQRTLMHAVEIVGYKHPDDRISNWWRAVYIRLRRSSPPAPGGRRGAGQKARGQRSRLG